MYIITLIFLFFSFYYIISILASFCQILPSLPVLVVFPAAGGTESWVEQVGRSVNRVKLPIGNYIQRYIIRKTIAYFSSISFLRCCELCAGAIEFRNVLVVPFTLHLDATRNGSAAEYVKIKTIASTF